MGSRRGDGTTGHAGQDKREEIWRQAELFTSDFRLFTADFCKLRALFWSLLNQYERLTLMECME